MARTTKDAAKKTAKDAEKKSTKDSHAHGVVGATGPRHKAEHAKLLPHDGPPKEPDPADIHTEAPEPQGDDAATRKPRTGKKSRQLSDSDRITVLEHRFEALARHLTTHGIHIPHDVAVESTED
jgi:hypothetical protein